ncbi:unnamed protein product [Vitrella brassicaformis CCMP3155]|uniref:uDENN domain-containing protein n=1 Tax=Vitrella brassicaformis (strain CCMP3155) TaxID=1169540 RepID=A0A0G4GHL4_VITBC|nr:unnamed protein product [Vitrella brassicaformis CCMP3155]|eukprot:CEM29222.1 unnamed protein product [Vitrella brassicaformis CCMP3155]
MGWGRLVIEATPTRRTSTPHPSRQASRSPVTPPLGFLRGPCSSNSRRSGQCRFLKALQPLPPTRNPPPQSPRRPSSYRSGSNSTRRRRGRGGRSWKGGTRRRPSAASDSESHIHIADVFFRIGVEDSVLKDHLSRGPQEAFLTPLKGQIVEWYPSHSPATSPHSLLSAGLGGPSSPSSRKDSSPSAAMQQTLTSFCPPEGLWLYREEQGCPGPVFFSTVLWGLSRRAYVCCLMVWEPRAWPWDIDHGEMQSSGLIDSVVAVTDDGLDEADLEDYSRDSPAGASIVYVPTCLCFMTRQPLISSLKSVLYELYQLQQRTAKMSFLRHLLKTPTRPSPSSDHSSAAIESTIGRLLGDLSGAGLARPSVKLHIGIGDTHLRAIDLPGGCSSGGRELSYRALFACLKLDRIVNVFTLLPL